MIVLFDIPTLLTGFNFLMALFGVLLLIGGALIVLIVRGKGEVTSIHLERAVSAEALVKTRDAEIITLNKRIDELEEELEGLTSEHRTIVGISIAELMEFWAEKEEKEAELDDLKRQVRVLKRRKDGDA